MWIFWLLTLGEYLTVTQANDAHTPRDASVHFRDLPQIMVSYTVDDYNVIVLKRTTTSLTLRWEAAFDTNTTNVTSWEVRYIIDDEEFKSDSLPANQEHFTVEGLSSDTEYPLCVTLYFDNFPRIVSPHNRPSARTSCRYVRTIPSIRADSLIALFITLSLVAVVIIIGLVKWHVTKARYAKFAKLRQDSQTTDTRETTAPAPIISRCSIEVTT